MSLDADNLAGVNVGQLQLFMYTTADAIGTVDDADYFLGAYRSLNVGDVIIAVCSTGGTRTVDLLVVQTCSAAGVTVVLGT